MTSPTDNVDSLKGAVVHAEQVDPADEKNLNVVGDAAHAEAVEASMGVMEGLKTYPRAVFWSFSISLLIIMEGYDVAVLGSVIGLPQYREKFGVPVINSQGLPDFELLPAWQMAVNQAPNVGCIIGIFIASWAQDRWGYRRTLQIALVFLTGAIFIIFFSVNVQMLFIGELLCGLPWGAFSSSAVSYASDVTPIPLRGYLTTYVNLCWIIGQILAAGILYRVLSLPGTLAYQVAFAVQWVWPIPLFILVTLAPESPWFLVRKGRLEEARHAVSRLQSKTSTIDPADTVAMMVRTDQFELENEVGSSYLSCFRGADRRRTEISAMAWVAQVLCGMAFAGAPVYFFKQAGLNEENSFQLNLGITFMALAGTLASWVALTFGGRRPFFIGGMATMCGILVIIGGLSWSPNPNVKWAQAALIMIFVWTYDFTIGPLTYCIVGETSATRLRSKTVGLSRNAYNVTSIVGGILNTYMMNPLAWNWKSRSALFWAGTCLLMTIWSFFRLPEMKGRSYHQLDLLFERRTPTRKFKETVITSEDEV
ncbi:hypothetical protein CspHIS471_0309660 [Cutaneotrichosporon sp. HIS471]|nr:hypothetical protein CspHIS471_0309660 [Cutaneotrichosporon sp. HIS471]